jgi:hypothetical protein
MFRLQQRRRTLPVSAAIAIDTSPGADDLPVVAGKAIRRE